ncbi:PAS domain-containing sensor histidine kinase [Komagataeibacter oboediens]|uniref:histidine kinase n=1 Tax=Komagataeibacter oboediens TaxID=65958 RepID=A0A318QEC6_9PROT|nr:PAS domain-containing sensor histidine kinase [Komagataeibacter oboediens]
MARSFADHSVRRTSLRDFWDLPPQETGALARHRSFAAASSYALGLVILGTLIRFLINPFLGGRTLFLLLLPGVLVGAVIGGLFSGLAAATLASVIGCLLLAHDGAPPIENWVETILFATLCVLITCGGEWLLRARRRTAAMAQRILEREAHLSAILDAVPDAIIILDERGIVQSFSNAAETLLRSNAAEAIGTNIADIVPELGTAPVSDRHGIAAVARRKDGTTVPVDLSTGRLTSGEGSFTIAFLRDLTEREEADRRVRQLQAEVTHISRLSAMGEMAATLAHELNQPLTAITNFLNGGRRLLEAENGQSTRVQEAMDKAAAQALRAGRIIRSLRDFVSRGEGEPGLESLRALIEEMATLALVGIAERGIDVSFQLDSGADQVIADKIQIQQVLLNLIRNAVEAMEDCDERRLVVAVDAFEGMARIRVTDTGPGVSPEIAGRLFESFSTTKDHGMGVGLSICRTIVEAHGGRIGAQRERGGGMCFLFTLPCARTEEFGE